METVKAARHRASHLGECLWVCDLRTTALLQIHRIFSDNARAFLAFAHLRWLVFPDYGEIRKPADPQSYASISAGRAEWDLLRKVNGEWANAILYYIRFLGKPRKISGKTLGKARNSRTGMHNSDV